jgi:hypothetical protein
MPKTAAACTVLVLYALLSPATRADDAPRKTDDPDPGFLEFLGGVDGLADANPDYLAQAHAPRPPPAAPPPPPKPNVPPPPPSGPSGVKNNE